VLDGVTARELGVSGEGERGKKYKVWDFVNRDALDADCVWGDLGGDTPAVEIMAYFHPYQQSADSVWKIYASAEQVPGVGDDARVFPAVPPSTWHDSLSSKGYRLCVLVDNVLMDVTIGMTARPGESQNELWARFIKLKPVAVGIAQDAIGDLRD